MFQSIGVRRIRKIRKQDRKYLVDSQDRYGGDRLPDRDSTVLSGPVYPTPPPTGLQYSRVEKHYLGDYIDGLHENVSLLTR